jgi:queuine/archaeosine tRNA-ribosyltransferase
MANLLRRVGEKLRKTNLPQYQAYRDYVNPDRPFCYRGLIMLDSGGFSFGHAEKLTPLVRSPLPAVRRFARLMLAVAALENQDKWDRDRFRRLARLAQRLHLRNQLCLKPDIIVTLDRVIHFDLPYEIKRRRVLFNLICARTALAAYAPRPHPKPLLFAVIHPLGPPPRAVGKTTSEERARAFYTRTFTLQLKYLLHAETETGQQFGGFAVGSLVPVNNYAFLELLAGSLAAALQALGVGGRPLHAFGAADHKAVFLHRYGFTSFDSNLHMVKARNRQMYDPSSGSYKKMQPPTSCTCPICRRHPAEELVENRPGVKEVATVLQSLHNFYANHLAHLKTMRRLNE